MIGEKSESDDGDEDNDWRGKREDCEDGRVEGEC